MRALLVSADDSFAGRMSEALNGAYGRLDTRTLPHNPQDLLGLRGSEDVNVVVLDANGDDDAALELGAGPDARGLGVVLISDNAAELALPALRAGVEDLLERTASSGEIRAAVERAAIAARASAQGPSTQVSGEGQGSVITVVSPKGGVGKTTVASNLAIGLAGRDEKSTVLVDLDIHFGDVATALNLTPEFTLPDIATGPGSRDSIAAKSYLTRHETGLFVVPGSESPAAADMVTAEDVTRLVGLLKTQFDYVVVDTAPGLSEHALAALDATDTLVMVTSLDVPGVRGLRKELDTLAELRLFPASRHIVLNFYDTSRGLSIADVEASIQTGVDVVIPLLNTVPLSVNQGVPLLQNNGRDAATRELRRLVDRVAPVAVPTKRGLFGRRSS